MRTMFILIVNEHVRVRVWPASRKSVSFRLEREEDELRTSNRSNVVRSDR